MGTRGCNRRNLVLASWTHISWRKAPWHLLQSAHLMVGNGGREGTNLPDVYDKACWGPFGCFSCLFFFISSRIDKTVPTIFPTALSGGITAVLRVSLFICYKHDLTVYTERMWSFRPTPPFLVSIPPIGNVWDNGFSTFMSAKKGKAGAGQWTGNRKLVIGRKSNPKGMWKWRWSLWAVSHFLGNGNIIWKPWNPGLTHQSNSNRL